MTRIFPQELLTIGVNSGDAHLDRKIFLSNFMCLLFTLCMMGFLAIFALAGLWAQSLYCVVWISVMPLWILANRYHFYQLSRLGILLWTCIFGAGFCYLVGRESQFHLGYFCVIGVPLIIFLPREKIQTALCMFVIVACYFILQWFPYTPSPYSLDPDTSPIARIVIDVTVFFVTFITVFYFYQQNRLAEDRLKKTIGSLEREIQKRKEKEEELERFAYIASHDLQEPLRTISSYLTLFSKRYAGKLDRDANEFISIAVDGAKRMSNMIRSLLEYSRIENRSDSFKEVDLNHTLSSVQKSLEALITKENAKIHLEPLCQVWGNPEQLERLFQNLISNAIKYKKESRLPEIWISLKSDSGLCHVFVKDNGKGISPESLPNVFNLFERGDHRGNAELEGTGIGLSACKKIVESHGGGIQVDSTFGEGSTFVVTLPTENIFPRVA